MHTYAPWHLKVWPHAIDVSGILITEERNKYLSQHSVCTCHADCEDNRCDTFLQCLL